ncbi:hypothetical protein [Pantoea dispersa]|uniref:hypothetical protein n=1 Tax=Pantoea dispersa TaxID=59814 RepID=UPI00123BB6F4|nr:hypothetical protein [Pantoea dispersa]KAA8671457.1 hypothetical protein F4W08_10010 [Pantoea dispersa]
MGIKGIISLVSNSSTQLYIKRFNNGNLSNGLLFFLLLTFFFIFSLGQFTNVYIRHDDWEFMTRLAPDMKGFVSPWDKTLLEGRWINYLWSYIAYYLPAKTVYCLFIFGYALFCWRASLVITDNTKTTFIAAVLFFLCPAYADLSFWPATLSPSVWIVTVILCFFYIKESVSFLFIIVSAVLMLTYQPMIPACFLLFSIRMKTCASTIKIGIYYYVGYVIGVIVIYILNYHFHDYLGVKIADWRHPNPVHSFSDLINNFKKSMHTWHDIFLYYNWVVISSLLGLLVIAKISSGMFMRLLVAVIMIMFFETLMQTYTGVDIPARSLIWPWVFFVSVFSILANNFSYNSIRLIKPAIFLSAFIIFISCFHLGFVNWIGFYTYENRFSQYEDYLGNYLKSQPNQQVFVCGDFSKVQGYQRHDFKELALAIWKKHAINITPLPDNKCDEKNLQLGINILNGVSYYRVN